jgi:hypothetical protein
VELPFGAGHALKSSRQAVNAVIGGWQLNGIFTAMTGAPLQISQSRNGLNTPGTPQNPYAVRQPEYIKKETAFDAYSGIYWFNPDAILPNFTNNEIGNIPRRVSWLRGPGITQLDASLFRNFRYRERFTFEVRAEAMNVTNSTHFGDPNTPAPWSGTPAAALSARSVPPSGSVLCSSERSRGSDDCRLRVDPHCHSGVGVMSFSIAAGHGDGTPQARSRALPQDVSAQQDAARTNQPTTRPGKSGLPPGNCRDFRPPSIELPAQHYEKGDEAKGPRRWDSEDQLRQRFRLMFGYMPPAPQNLRGLTGTEEAM